jgi:predicted outer membrane repeat protein
MLRIFSHSRWLLLASMLFALTAVVGAHPVFAGGVVGNGTPASCTETALGNALSGGGTVTFNCGAYPKTIKITFAKQIAANTTLDGGNKITLKAINAYHFQVFNGYTFTIKNIKLTNGSSAGGGSIQNFGTTSAINVTFQNNTATGVSTGGAVYNNGTFKAKNSTFTSNKAANGGAIYNDGGTVVVRASTLTGNQAVADTLYGGAIANNAGTLRIKGSTFFGNLAKEGGALYTEFGTTNVIKKSTFDSNQSTDSGGAINNLGNTTIAASVIKNNIAGNTGGGISHGGTLTMQTTTVSGNHASSGGGMRDFGNSTTILTSTFSGNVATTNGGGIFSSWNTVLRNSTLSGNQAGSIYGGGGLYQYGGGSDLQFVTIANNKAGYAGGVYSESSKNGSIQMENVLLSKNQNGNCGGATLISLGGNLSSDTYCSAFTQSHDKQNKNAKLGPLANNGGPTMTHMLLSGSPAINNAFNIVGITKDQRGVARPKGSAPDTGAVEAQ